MKWISGFLLFAFCVSQTGRAGENGLPFLGVATRPLSAVESRELNLPAGVGLRVEEVVAGSPAASDLVFGDVLHKLDDQILVNPQQLAVLVRLRDPGETVNLRVFGETGPQELAVKLGERPLIELARTAPGRSAPSPHLPFPPGFDAWDPWGGTDLDPFERMERLQAEMRAMMRGVRPGMPRKGGVHRSRRVEWVEDGASIQLNETDGDSHLTIMENGKVVFDGPVNTPEQRAKVPDTYREKLEGQLGLEYDPSGAQDDGTLL